MSHEELEEKIRLLEAQAKTIETSLENSLQSNCLFISKRTNAYSWLKQDEEQD